MTKRRIAAEPRRFWTDAEHAQFVAQYPHMQTKAIAAMLERPVKAVYTRAKAYGLTKSAEYLASPLSGRTNGRQGFYTRFVKGQVSWNKGRRYKPGGRAAETQFRKGQMPHNWKPVGTTRINAEGYLDIKVDNTAKGPKAWAAVHRLNWIAAHGPIPKGYFIRFKDGNQRNPLVENLELVDRATHLYRNYHGRYPLEVRRLIQLRGALQRQINRREGNEQDRGLAGNPVRHAARSARQGKADGDRPRQGRGRGRARAGE